MASDIDKIEEATCEVSSNLAELSASACASLTAINHWAESNVDFSGLSSALKTFASNIPQYDYSGITSAVSTMMEGIDTSGLATALKGIDTSGLTTALSGIDTTGLSTALSGIDTTGLSALGDITDICVLPDTDEFISVIEPEVTLSDTISAMMANISSLLAGFASRMKEMFSGLSEKMSQVIDVLKMSFAHAIGHMIFGFCSFMHRAFRLPPPKAVFQYKLYDALRPAIPLAHLNWNCWNYAPKIRGIYLRRGRERGTSSDADSCMLITV